ncbi:MAG: FtsW/RodA/SpoVE family cell cycle protein [Candidatus Promineifilaceae bacterium]|nr:FtsW/RodA/SpoVE family cell cycle protein [Candidatus Promineifilaceae bacterium]
MYSRLAEDFQEISSRWEGRLLAVSAVFIVVNALAYSLVSEGKISWQHLWGPLVWLLAMLAAHVLLVIYRPGHDPVLLPIFALLTGWGIILVDRLAENFLSRQILWVLLGTAALVSISILPRNLRPLRRYRYSLLIVGFILLGLTLVFGVNPSGFGAALWLPLPLPYLGPIVFFQPSELLKLLLVIFLSSYFADRGPLLRQYAQGGVKGALPFLAPLLVMWGFCLILLVWQRDLGTATLFFVLFLSLLYLATGSKLYSIVGFILLLGAGLLAYFLFDVVTLRVDAWWNPWPEALDRAFQIVQSLYAIAAGGLVGQGVGQGFPYFIPVVHSDFVFAAVAEEWGLIGSLSLVALFLLLAYRGFRLAAHNKNPFRYYLAAGLTLLFSFQSLLIMAGVTKLLPLTGITLPFISYGGSSLLMSSFMLGLLMFMSDPK